MRDIENILSSISDAVWSFDLVSHKFIYINDRLSELYQTPLHEIAEQPSFWLKYVHPDDYKYAVAATASLYTQKKIELEYRLLVDDEVKWVTDKRVVLFDGGGKPTTINGIISDITVKKQSEALLADSKNTYHYFFINNPNPLWIYERKSLRFLAVNNAAIAKYGYSKEEFLSMTIGDIRPPEDLQALINHVQKVDKIYSTSNKCWRHRKKNGDFLYVNISGHGIIYNGSDAEIVMVHDITPEVENRKTITLAKENLDTLINSIEEEIWSIDTNYSLISANHSFKRKIREMIGRDLIIGESVFMSEYPDEELAHWRGYYDKALKGESFTFTDLVNLPHRQPLCIETKMNPIKNGPEIIGVACISTDIQERLKAHESIIEQNMKLREVISLASHEIRGPVASLLGLISAYKNVEPSTQSHEEFMQLISTLTTNLDEVLHELVDKSYSLRQESKIIKKIQYNQSMNESL